MMNDEPFDLQDCLTAMHMYAVQAATPSSGRGPGDWTFWTCKAEIAGKLADEIERLDADAACERAEKESLKLEVERLAAERNAAVLAADEALAQLRERIEVEPQRYAKLTAQFRATAETRAAESMDSEVHPPSNMVTCTCAYVAPTMPMYRTEHLAWCPCWILQRGAVIQNEVTKAVAQATEALDPCSAVRVERDRLKALLEQTQHDTSVDYDELARERDRLKAALERIAKGDGWYPMHAGVQVFARAALGGTSEPKERS